jgi:hypothetical protein
MALTVSDPVSQAGGGRRAAGGDGAEERQQHSGVFRPATLAWAWFVLTAACSVVAVTTPDAVTEDTLAGAGVVGLASGVGLTTVARVLSRPKASGLTVA